jgi:hypothetical protein
MAPLQFNTSVVNRSKSKYSQTAGLGLRPRIADRTKAKRDRIWATWLNWAKSANIDSDQHWIDLARDNTRAIEMSQAFLNSYYETSKKEVTTLDEPELESRKLVHRINSATTLEDIWAIVTNEANATVMHRQRLLEPGRAWFWNLSYSSREPGSTNKPAYKVVRVSLRKMLVYDK